MYCSHRNTSVYMAREPGRLISHQAELGTKSFLSPAALSTLLYGEEETG